MTRTAWWVVLVLATAGWGEGAKPELRIDPGGHASGVVDICFVNAGRQVATRGADGTVRVWDLANGEQSHVLRLRQQGHIGFVCVSPDGRWLATRTDLGRIAVYDTVTWRLTRVLRGAPTGFSAITPDSRHLLACDWPFGLVVYDVASGQRRAVGVTAPAGADVEGVQSVAISPDGHKLAVGHYRSVSIQPVQGGAARVLQGFAGLPVAVAWLDSRRLLVETNGQPPRLSQWDVATGTKLCEWGNEGGPGGLALSADAQTAWVSGYGGPVAYAVADGVRKGSLPYGSMTSRMSLSPDGRLLACTAQTGGFAVFAVQTGTLVADHRPPVQVLTSAGWREADSALGYGMDNRAYPVRPDSALQQWFRPSHLDSGTVNGPSGWCRPVWQCRYGTIVHEGQPPMVQVLDAEGKKRGPAHAFVGSATWLRDGRLALFHRSRLEVVSATTSSSEKMLTGVLLGVRNLVESPDSRYLLGSCAEGVLRIWPLTTKDPEVAPLLSIFPAKDGNWIAWTEEGYYACTPAAEKWIGWQINRGEDEEPDYYPAAQFREQFYRPDVIMRLLDAGSVAEAVKQADAARKQQTDATKVAARIAEFAPPKVEILEPADGATVATAEITVRLRVKDPNNRKVVAVIPLVNGRPLTGGRFILVPSRDPNEQQVTVPLTPGENTISAIATNDAGSHSVPVSVTVRYGAEEQKPAMYVLAVGVSAYANRDYTLRYAAKDATDLASILKQQEGKLFRKVEVKLLTDKEASQGGVLDGLEWLTKQVTQRDYAVVFLAGHGLADSAGEYYFLPSDGDTNRLRRTGLHWSQFRTALRAMPGKVLLALDTCHSAGATGARAAGARLDYTNVLRDALSDEVGLITMSSCMPSEVSFEQDDWNNGAFTKALVEALSGKADHNGDGVVTLAELDAYISERVKALTMGRQHATCERPATVRSVLPVVMVK